MRRPWLDFIWPRIGARQKAFFKVAKSKIHQKKSFFCNQALDKWSLIGGGLIGFSVEQHAAGWGWDVEQRRGKILCWTLPDRLFSAALSWEDGSLKPLPDPPDPWIIVWFFYPYAVVFRKKCIILPWKIECFFIFSDRFADVRYVKWICYEKSAVETLRNGGSNSSS